MKRKKFFPILLVGIVAVLMATLMLSTVETVEAASSDLKISENANEISVQKTLSTYSQCEVSVKYKKVKTFTLSFNANGGKVNIKSKKLAYKKSLGTLPKPSRTGYTFHGWFTAKKGGKKVTETSKMPSKNAVIYAQWKKTNKVLSASEKELVGDWILLTNVGGAYTISGQFIHTTGHGFMYSFENDGTLSQTLIGNTAYSKFAQVSKGTWSASGGIIYITYSGVQKSSDGGKTWSPSAPHWKPKQTIKYKLGTDDRGKYLENLDGGVKYRKL